MMKGGNKDKGRKKAVALGYTPEKNNAPTILAKGSGHVAERITTLATDKGIPLYEDSALVEALSAVDVGREIPEELYRAVAEVLAFIYALDGHMAQGKR